MNHAIFFDQGFVKKGIVKIYMRRVIKKVNSVIRAYVPQNIIYSMVHYIRWYKSLIYMGSRFQCPICQGNFRLFFSNGSPQRPNSLCPRCFCKERHRLLWLYLNNCTNLFTQNNTILYVAPMDAIQRKFRKKANLDYISIDLYSPLAMLKMDITNLEFSDNTFDCIICLHVLEHISNEYKAISELRRVLKPSGWAIIQVPVQREQTFEDMNIVTEEERLKAYGQEDHVRSYGLDYKQRLEYAGFSVNIDDFYQKMDTNIKEKYGLVDNLECENIYVCSLPNI